MSLHILIGHEKPGQRGTASALYVGSSGVDLQAAKAKATCGSFTIFSNPQGQRKSNPAYVAPVPVEAAPHAKLESENETTEKAKQSKHKK